MKCFPTPANNLYGWAQCQPMPENSFAWITPDELNNLDWENMSESQEEGYIIEVDLSYPEHLHASHSSFPLAPERLVIDNSMWSPYSRGILY
jgi:hypothetical protein